VSIQTMINNTHSQGVILFFNKQNWGTSLKFGMSNEPYFEIFINIFSKCHEFFLWQIVDGHEWRLCTFFKINCAIIWLMLWQGVNILLLKHISLYILYEKGFRTDVIQHFVWENINWKCISFIYHMHENLCSHE